jgi:protein involved in polysaccharide export with SLBB domain/beta-lactamase regulating signal transducer with metallopeptidase domain
VNDLWNLGSAEGWHGLAIDVIWQPVVIGAAAIVALRLLRVKPADRAAIALAAVLLCMATPLGSSLVRWGGWGVLAQRHDEDRPTPHIAHGVIPASALQTAQAYGADKPATVDPILVERPAAEIQSWLWRIFGVVWLLASAGLALRLARSALAVRRTCRAASLCQDAELNTTLAKAAQVIGVHPPQLFVSATVASPALVAGMHPRILIPADVNGRGDWFAVCCHELAHLARGDGLTRLVVEVAVVVVPWQPIVWLLRHDFRVACEEACDDWAIAAGADPVEFASTLLDFVPQAGSLLVLGMSESVVATRGRILRLLAMQGVPRPKLNLVAGIAGWLVAIALAVLLALMQYGRNPWGGATDFPPWGNTAVSVAAAKASPPSGPPPLKPYVIDSPDVLLIDAVKVVPKPPYHIEPQDTLEIFVLGTLPDQNIAGPYPVEADGTIMLGPAYGAIKVSGLSPAEVRDAIKNQLKGILTAPEVSVSLFESVGQQQISGEHLVGPDGTVNLGTYGFVRVGGLEITQARQAIESHLKDYLDEPKVSVDVYAYNSKVYFVVVEEDGATVVHRIPCTGRERVLDALSQVPAAKLTKTGWVWVSRTLADSNEAQILPVDWRAIFRGESNATNYWIEAGDRIFVQGN